MDGTSPRRRTSGRRRPLALLLAGLTILTAAWTFTNPPFQAPDEWSHYIRAYGIGSGEMIGPKTRYDVPPGVPATIIKRAAWINQAAREVQIPGNFYAPFITMACTADRPTASADCLDATRFLQRPTTQITPVGNYEPPGYVLPAAGVRIGDSPWTRLYWGRIGNALGCLALLALAGALLWDGRRKSVVGLGIAATPMVLFLAGSINPSGLEVAAGVAFVAAILRLSRDTGRAPARWEWTVAALTGALLAFSRSPGPAWVVLIVAVGAVLAGRKRLKDLLLEGYERPAAFSTTLVGGICANLAWERSYGSHMTLDPVGILSALPDAILHLPWLLKQEVGVFGAIDSQLPGLIYALWGVALVGLLEQAFLAGKRRERLSLSAALLAAVVLPVVLDAIFRSGTDFPGQGRHVLPFTVIVPMLAWEILLRRTPGPLPVVVRNVMLACTAVFTVTQVLAIWFNGRRYAFGTDGGMVSWISNAEWSPPLGWWPWIAVTLVGTLLVAIAQVEAVLESDAPAADAVTDSAPRGEGDEDAHRHGMVGAAA